MKGAIMSNIHKGMNGRFVHEDGSVYWLKDGQFHCEDGPSIEGSDGSQYWYINDQLHRENGPAMINAGGTQYWYQHGDLHREDGPAYEDIDGTKLWFLNGQKLTEEQFKHEVEKKALNTKLHSTLAPKPIFKRCKI